MTERIMISAIWLRFVNVAHLKHDRSRHAYSRRYGSEVFYVNGYLFTLDAIRPQIVPIKNINAIPLNLFDHRLQSPVLVKTLFDDVERIA